MYALLPRFRIMCRLIQKNTNISTLAKSLYLAFALVFCPFHIQAEPQFPVLTGRIVDQARLLSQSDKATLTTTLASHEQRTGNQIVIVTLSSLEGHDIADYGYQLGRHWGIGKADRNNRALLIIAPNERKVRIEVGYGLEGTLTDARSHQIIQQQILPQFKSGDFPSGIRQGATAIIATIESTNTAPLPRSSPHNSSDSTTELPFYLIVGMMFLGQFFGGIHSNRIFSSLFSGVIGGLVVWLLTRILMIGLAAGILLALFSFFSGRGPRGPGRFRRTDPGYYSGYGGGGIFGGGGFSTGGGFGGAGGSFGGGGASGSW